MYTKLTLVGCVFVIAAPPLAGHAAEPASARTSTHVSTTRASTQPAATQPLDLKAPEVTRIFSIQQIDAILSRAIDPALEHVEVQAPRIGDLPFEDNSASTAEVVFDSVVRWFVPSQSYAARVNVTPDATDPYRSAPLMQFNYHASFAPPASQR